MITQNRTMTRQASSADMALLSDLQREIARLESERQKAVSRSDKLLAQLATDDTGFTFHRALSTVNGLNDRIQQLRKLAEKVRSRIY